MYEILIPLLSAIIGGSIVAFVNYLLDIKKRKAELKEEFKRKAYGKFLNKARSFLNDPNLTKEDTIKYQKEFIEKYYNEIMVSAPKEVIKLVEDFFDTVSISFTNEDKKTRAIDNLLKGIRKDLGLNDISSERLFKSYTPNTKKIEEEKTNNPKI